MKHLQPEAGEVYSCYVKKLNKYGAYQILSVAKKSICYVTLDYLEEVPPTEAVISSLTPLYREMYRYNHEIAMTYTSNDHVPKDYIYIGICEPVTDKSCNTFSGDWNDGLDYVIRAGWEAIDAEACAAYKKYINSGEQVKIGNNWYKKNWGCMRNDLYQDLLIGGDIRQLPCITSAQVDGYSAKLVELMKASSLLKDLRLNNPGVGILDLRETYLDNLELDMTGVTRLYLPKETKELDLTGEIREDLQIDDSACVQPIDLRISLKKAKLHNFGLKQILSLRVFDIKELDIACVVQCFPELEKLGLWGAPGIITNITALENLQSLRTFIGEDIFGYSEEEIKVLEKLPKLNRLYLESIPKEAGTYLKRRWINKLDTLEITHLRDEGWLADNLTNPLRHWDGSEFVPHAAYKKAFSTYKNTKKLMQEADSKEVIVVVAMEYIEFFNKLNAKYDEFIETEEREDIFMAMEQIYKECLQYKNLISLQELYDVMDGERDDW